MKHLVNQATGVIVLTPECDANRKILYHLINCSDLSQFSEYIEYQNHLQAEETTTDLGVPGEECIRYMMKYEPVTRSPIDTGEQRDSNHGRLIGFNRERAIDGVPSEDFVRR